MGLGQGQGHMATIKTRASLTSGWCTWAKEAPTRGRLAGLGERPLTASALAERDAAQTGT